MKDRTEGQLEVTGSKGVQTVIWSFVDTTVTTKLKG